MKLTKRKLKQLVKEGLAKGLGNLQLEVGDTGGEEKFSGNVKEQLTNIVNNWKPTTPEGKEYERQILAVIQQLGVEITAG